jgi:hypothetical protein
LSEKVREGKRKLVEKEKRCNIWSGVQGFPLVRAWKTEIPDLNPFAGPGYSPKMSASATKEKRHQSLLINEVFD